MILIGAYDNPFVRRVAIALIRLDMAFEHRPWADSTDLLNPVAALNPLGRTPVLVLDGGETLIDSGAILDALDQLHAIDLGPLEPASLTPRDPLARRQTLQLTALATGVVEIDAAPPAKGRRAALRAALDALESDCALSPGPYWFGKTLTHGDIMVVCAVRFLRDRCGDGCGAASRWPRLLAYAERCERLPGFFDTAPQRPGGTPR